MPKKPRTPEHIFHLPLVTGVQVQRIGCDVCEHRRPPQPSVATSTPASMPAQSSVRTLAVLPFRDLSGESGEVWGIGVADAIISRLAILQNLAVRPTNSVLKYAKGADDPAQAARELEVNSVLAGTYQRLGGVMRVSVQLIDHGAARWAARYDLQVATFCVLKMTSHRR